MAVSRPTSDQLINLAREMGATLTPDEASGYAAVMQGGWDDYDRLDAELAVLPTATGRTASWHRPDAQEDPLNAWYCTTDIQTNTSGPLAGKTVALKDNVALAGVPMMVGAAHIDGFVPDHDAVIVTRMLDAGAKIVGKAACQHLCFSGGSHLSDAGPVHNPHRHGWSAGGSSSGSAALVAAGKADMAIGGDQGGSIRIPASYCGIYGMKPTFGLVPYTGIMPIENTLDHAGPMTATVADNALLLQVLAGADDLDPRQYSPQVGNYTGDLDRGVQGLRIGLLKEGFGVAGMQDEVAATVRAAAHRFAALGAVVEEVSVPEFTLASAVWVAIAVEGATQQMMFADGPGYGTQGLYDTALAARHATWRNDADALSPAVKLTMLQAMWIAQQYRGKFYGKAQNLRRRVKAAFDAAFSRYDLLLCPTLPLVATELPPVDASLAQIIARGFEMTPSTTPFNVTGHPSMSAPCGRVDALPVGMMLTAADWNEVTIYRAAAAFEGSFDWRTL